MNETLLPAAAGAVRRREPWMGPALAALAVLGVLLAWAWWTTRSELGAVREELALRLRDSDKEAREARTVAREAQDGVRDTQARIGALEAKLLESQSQQLALESLYAELSRSRDEWVLADVEQSVAIAAQQLQLAGNVQAALVALESADARLARADRPHLIGLRKAIARDIERLKAAPALDVPGMTLRLDQVIAAVDALPLLVDGRGQADAKAAHGEDATSGGWRSFWQEFKGLVRVQRLDAADASLLAPESRYFLRENLKLRLLHARLALLQRDENAFRADVRAATAWLNRYFDARQKPVANAVATLGQLNVAAVNVELPSIADSVNAVRAYKSPRERAVK
jgi:uroporphyrin-3 C-methyltransferase